MGRNGDSEKGYQKVEADKRGQGGRKRKSKWIISRVEKEKKVKEQREEGPDSWQLKRWSSE